ncbi:unnamed protein product [Camellia sinensis]
MFIFSPKTLLEFLYLSVILAFLSILITIFSVRHRSNHGVKLPPGSFGWPVIGESIEFLFGKPENFVNYRMKKYSQEIFKTKIFGEKTAVICGPNGNKFLFSNERKIFTGFLPHSKQKLFLSSKLEPAAAPPVPPLQVVAAVAADDVKEVIRTPGFFKPEALSSYLGMIDSISQQHLRLIGKVYPLAKTLTLLIACRIFLGMENPDRIARLVRYFDDVTLGLHSIMVNFPGTNFYQASKAADAIRRELMAVVRERRAAMVGGGGAMKQDILSHMIVVSDPIGKGMGEAEIADKMMGLLVAGYANVAATISFFMKFVGESPDIYNKCLQQLGISKDKKTGELLDWNDMSTMKYSWNVMCEVMRLVPPQQGTFREVLTDFTYAGYTIPKGWKVYWTVNTTNKNSKYFRDPEKFDPSRYEGGEAPAPYTYVPFGGGPRLCPRKEYARLVVLTFVHNVVKKYKWEVLFPKEKVLGDMVPMPEKGGRETPTNVYIQCKNSQPNPTEAAKKMSNSINRGEDEDEDTVSKIPLMKSVNKRFYQNIIIPRVDHLKMIEIDGLACDLFHKPINGATHPIVLLGCLKRGKWTKNLDGYEFKLSIQVKATKQTTLLDLKHIGCVKNIC